MAQDPRMPYLINDYTPITHFITSYLHFHLFFRNLQGLAEPFSFNKLNALAMSLCN